MYLCKIINTETNICEHTFYLSVATEKEAREYCDMQDFGKTISVVSYVGADDLDEADDLDARNIFND